MGSEFGAGPGVGATLTDGTQRVVLNAGSASIGTFKNERLEVTGTGSALNDTPIAATDVGAYRWVSLQLVGSSGSYNGTVTFEASNDGSTYSAVALLNANAGNTSAPSTTEASTPTTGRIYHGPLSARYFRVRVSTGVSGGGAGTSVACTAEFSTLPTTMQGQFVPFATAAALSDTTANPTTTLVGADLMLWNGSQWERERGTTPSATVGITASGVTTTQTGTDQTNYNHRGVKVVLDMTNAGTGSVTLEIDGKDEVSGKYYAILTGAAVVSNSTNVYTVYPGITTAANAAVSDTLPRTWRVKVTANNANATTYTVGASLIR